MATELWAVGLTAFCTVLGAFGAVLLKKGSGKFSLHPIALMRNFPLIGGITLYVLATALFIPALRGGDLSVLYPIISLSYVWVAILSMLWLGERMNRFKWAGIAVILIGVSMIGFARSAGV